MADKDVSVLSASSEEQQLAAKHFEYAHRASTAGNHDLAIQMLRSSCRLVPGNLSYRQTLRKVEKSKYRDNKRGSMLAPLTSWLSKYRMWRAQQSKNHRKVLEYGEAVLARNPWDKDAHLLMAQAAVAIDLPVVAIWLLQDIRQVYANDVRINRALARLLEKQGYYQQAMHLWELIRKVLPTDREAQDKAKQMAVSDTIARGNYEGVIREACASGSGQEAVEQTRKAFTPGSSANFPALKPRAVLEAEALRAQIQADPTRSDPYLQLAALSRRQGHLDEAKTILEQGLVPTGQAPELILALAEVEIETQKRLLKQTEEQLRSRPEEEKLKRTRKKLQQQIETLELDWYRQKIQRDPNDRVNRFELGVRLVRAGEIEQAIREFQAVRSDSRLGWQALQHLGYCFKTLENWPLAQRNFEEALRLIPGSEQEHRKELLFQLAEGYAQAGDLERATELGLDLANLDYSYGNIGTLLAEWQKRLSKKASSRPR